MVFEYASAAFLTQTVTIDEQTTVKFEIWYMFPIRLPFCLSLC